MTFEEWAKIEGNDKYIDNFDVAKLIWESAQLAYLNQLIARSEQAIEKTG